MSAEIIQFPRPIDDAPSEEGIVEMLADLVVIWGKVAKLRGERRAEVCRLAGEAMGQGLLARTEVTDPSPAA